MSGQSQDRSRAGKARTGAGVGRQSTKLKNTLNAGDTHITLNDHSRHDHSRHHHGDTTNSESSPEQDNAEAGTDSLHQCPDITNYNHYGEAHHDMVIQRKCERALKGQFSRITRGLST